MSLPRPSGLKAPSKIGPELPNPPPPADDFIIGDRIWVSGNKPGFIAFLGETQFAAGEWAGIVLDRPDGKNDGSVQGIRYFQCEPKRGVFARISKLSRTPNLMPSATPRPEENVSESGQNSVKATPNGAHMRPTTPKLGLTASRGPLGSSSSLNKAPVMSLGGKPASAVSKPMLKVGDRVLVSGTKMGTLKYVGFADFAKGDWAGVDLDEKQGKNDGAVAGKRYFECRPMYGLFAPLHKVARLTSGAGPGLGTGSTTPSPQARSLMNTSLRLSRERSGSQESVSSISSTASSVSRSRVRLGVTSLSNQAKSSQRPSTLNLSATTAALQKALKEKEEHIEQLLRERDLERAEVARAAAHVDEAEGELTTMRVQNERLREDTDDAVVAMKAHIQQLEKEKSNLLIKLEDEKRKVEDLQFQIEEEAITKDDLESRTEEEEAKHKDLEKNCRREKERAEKFEQELYGLKALLKDQSERLSDTDDQNVAFLDQIEELTHKVSQAENKVKGYESTRLEEGAKTSQVSIELEEKATKVIELEDTLSARNREVKDLQNKLSELNEEVKTSTQRKQKMQENIDNLSAQLTSSGDASNNLTTDIQKLKSQVSDQQRKLDSTNDKEKQLSDEKNALEQQMSDLMRNSGDSSKRLSLMNEQLTERNRKIQELQTDLSNSTQKWGRIKDELAQLQLDKDREKQTLIYKHEENIQKFRIQIEDMQRALDKSNNKMKTMSEDLEKDKEEAIKRKLGEIKNLKKQLEQSKEDLEKQEVQTQAHRQVLDTITIEKDALQFEKEKAEKQVKRLETEKETLSGELIHARVDVSKLQSNYDKVVSEHDNTTEQVTDLNAEIVRVNKLKKEQQKQKEDALSEREAAISERESLQREVIEGKVTLQQKDMHLEELQKKLEELQKEIDKLRMESSQHEETISQLSEQEVTTGALQSQLEERKTRISQLQTKLKDMEAERDTMKAQLEFSNLVAEERKRLEDQNVQLTKDMETLQTRFSKELEKHDAVKTSLQTELDNSAQLLTQKEEDADSYRKQIANLKNENSSLEVYRSSVASLEEDRDTLRNTVRSLELAIRDTKAEAKAAITEARNAAAQEKVNNLDVTGSSMTARHQEEKTALEGQVEFLNSVIVDLQKKNQESQIRLEAMETGVVTNGNSDTSMDASPKKAPPRLFCDICDVFDQHDTDDCPLQAMDYDEPKPSNHHGDRKHMRAYCDICEEFHEPCVLPDGIIDDPISPIKVKITPASGESDRSDGQLDVTNSTKDVSSDDFLRQEVFSGSSNIASESSQISQDIEDRYDSTGQSETHATMERSYDEQKEQDHHSTDGSDSLLKPGDMDTQYISDEDLIEHGDFVRGKVTNTDDRDHSKTDLPEQSHSSITVEGSSDDEEDAVVHSVEMREEFGEELDDYIDDSVDEFLASEKLEADDVKEADKESNTEHELDSKEKVHSSCNKDMQVIQDLSGQNPEDQQLHSIIPSLEGSENVPMTNPDEETIGSPGNEYESEQSENDLNMSVNEPTSGVDAKLQICQESVHTDQHDDCSINGEIQEQPSIPEWHGQCVTTDEHQHNMDEVSGQSTASDENLQECVTVEGNGECATNDEESSPEECKNAGPSSASDPDFMSGQESFHTERHGVCVTNDSDTSNIDEVKEPPSACETYLQSDQGIVDNAEPSDDITKDDEESNSTDQVKGQSSCSDADFQCGQESVGNDAPSDDIANDEAHSDDECKNEELAAQSSASDADFQSGQESVGNEEPDDDIHVDDTISDDDGNVFECTSDLPEVSAKEADLDEPIGDQGNDLDEDYTNAVGGESSEDKQVKEKEEKHLDIIEDEKKRDLGNVNTTEGEEGMTPDEAEYPDDKDEKCKIS